MKICGICGANELIERNELGAGMCKYCMVNLFGNNEISDFAG